VIELGACVSLTWWWRVMDEIEEAELVDACCCGGLAALRGYLDHIF
jgi:hypothetical protein